MKVSETISGASGSDLVSYERGFGLGLRPPMKNNAFQQSICRFLDSLMSKLRPNELEIERVFV